jgi:pimeloyl-ACP methyl ester carboxylesterase
MAAPSNRKISAASARAHTRKTKSNSAFQLPSGLLKKMAGLLFICFMAWAYQAIHPPPPKICGSPNGPPVTATRIKLSDGRHLAYTEFGVPKLQSNYKIVFIHAFDSCRLDIVIQSLSPDVVEGLGIHIVSFDRPGYGESDPNPNQTEKSLALDIEELADQLELGSKFYVIGFSLGGQVTWACLKYIPHRLAGASLISPAVNYWWPGFPENLTKQAFSQQLSQDQWTYCVAHYLPWLTYWWNTQKIFNSSSLIAQSPAVLSDQDLRDLSLRPSREDYAAQVRQQGEYESVHRDLNNWFGNWGPDPMDMKNPFANGEGSVHLWQGDEDKIVSVTLQRYIKQKLPWVNYHELSGSGHFFPYAPGISDDIVKALLNK